MNGVTIPTVRRKNSPLFLARLDAITERRFTTISKASSSFNSPRSTFAAISSSKCLAERFERRRLQTQTPKAASAHRRKGKSPESNRATQAGITYLYCLEVSPSRSRCMRVESPKNAHCSLSLLRRCLRAGATILEVHQSATGVSALYYHTAAY